MTNLRQIRTFVLDSNLLLLLTVGTFEPRTLASFKRLSAFTLSDLRLLQAFVLGRKLLVTPHLLTEVSNLANSLPEPAHLGFLAYLSKFVPRTTEHWVEAITLVTGQAFSLFGLTGAAICELASTSLILTEDRRLRSFMERQNLPVLGLRELHQQSSSEFERGLHK